jgi:hypothetical protein
MNGLPVDALRVVVEKMDEVYMRPDVISGGDDSM